MCSGPRLGLWFRFGRASKLLWDEQSGSRSPKVRDMQREFNAKLELLGALQSK